MEEAFLSTVAQEDKQNIHKTTEDGAGLERQRSVILQQIVRREELSSMLVSAEISMLDVTCKHQTSMTHQMTHAEPLRATQEIKHLNAVCSELFDDGTCLYTQSRAERKNSSTMIVK